MLDDWELVFSDDFLGSNLDREKWVTCYWWADEVCTNSGNQELQLYGPEKHRARTGRLASACRF